MTQYLQWKGGLCLFVVYGSLKAHCFFGQVYLSGGRTMKGKVMKRKVMKGEEDER